MATIGFSTCRVTVAAAVLALAVPSARADDPATVGLETAATAIAWLTTHANGILATAYDRAPVLVTVLAALLILPVTALAAVLVQSLRLRVAEARRPRPELPPIEARDRHARATKGAVVPPLAPVAWLTDEGGQRIPLPPQLRLVRIGRHDDNDVRLSPATVHRHHAVIHRTPDLAYVISDVSGADGNGIRLNGERIVEARLVPGDAIDIGGSRMTFDSALPTYLAAIDQPTSTSLHTTSR